jgi:hypothetical protein
MTVSGTGASSLDVGGGINAGTGDVALVGTDGKINGPLSSTIIDDLSGANLTTLNASNISSGTLANARLPTNIDVGGTLDVTGATTLDSTVATGALTASSTITATQYLTGTASVSTDGSTNLYTSSGGSGPNAGMIVVGDAYGRVGIFWYGSYDTLTQLAGNSVYSATKDNATTINIYYESGNIVYQNKTAVDPFSISYTRILH